MSEFPVRRAEAPDLSIGIGDEIQCRTSVFTHPSAEEHLGRSLFLRLADRETSFEAIPVAPQPKAEKRFSEGQRIW